MIEFWNSWWPFILLITPFAIGIAGQVVTIYMVFCDLERVRSLFPNSRFLRNQLAVWSGSGFVARYMQVNAIYGAICLERYSVKRGELDSEEMAKIPAEVRARAWWTSVLLCVALAWLALAVIALKHLKS